MLSMASPPGPDRPSADLVPKLGEPRSLASDSVRDVSQEDFLFHLYRGSELLQENRVLEAKEELEFALTLQPLDAKGQDLLGAVYFRIGLYPRAIQIYEGLSAQFARDVSIKINLALCYLKTGQSEAARRTLQDAVRLNPEHKRAWGYLGLTLQKLGELEQAQVAFERGGHAMMAKRLTDRRQRGSLPGPSLSSAAIDEGVRSVAETAFSELDAGELRFALAEPQASRPGEGPWHTLELGEATRPKSPFATAVPPAASGERSPAPPLAEGASCSPGPAAAKSRADAPPPWLVPPPDTAVALHPTGVALVRVDEGQAFAGRLDALRVVTGPLSTNILYRRVRDVETSDVFGGIGSPIVRIAGAVELVLGPRAGRELAVVPLTEELAFVREEMLLGLELRLTYENGRVGLDLEGGPRAAPDSASVVQVRGTGALVVELAGKLSSVPCSPRRPVLVRREWLVGWIGRLVPRVLQAAESPNGQRGLIGFSGEGTVLVCAG
jgi:hypothetical protein